jgi:hypothetical protein
MMDKEALLVHLMFKSQYGSRLYGTNGPKSDVDWKYLFLPRFEDVLLGKQVMKTKFVSPNAEDKSKQVDEDFVPVQKFAYDFLKGVPYAVELAFGSMGEHADQKFVVPEFEYFMKELRETFLNKKLSGFLGFVNNVCAQTQKVLTMDPKDVYHGLRVAYQATQLLNTGNLVFPFPEVVRDRLLKVKNGDLDPRVACAELLDAAEHMDVALVETKLQDLTPELEVKFEKFMVSWLKVFYRVRVG